MDNEIQTIKKPELKDLADIETWQFPKSVSAEIGSVAIDSPTPEVD